MVIQSCNRTRDNVRLCQHHEQNTICKKYPINLVCVGIVLGFHVRSALNSVLQFTRLFLLVFLLPNIIQISRIFCVFKRFFKAHNLLSEKILSSHALFLYFRELFPAQVKYCSWNFLHYRNFRRLTRIWPIFHDMLSLCTQKWWLLAQRAKVHLVSGNFHLRHISNHLLWQWNLSDFHIPLLLTRRFS